MGFNLIDVNPKLAGTDVAKLMSDTPSDHACRRPDFVTSATSSGFIRSFTYYNFSQVHQPDVNKSYMMRASGNGTYKRALRPIAIDSPTIIVRIVSIPSELVSGTEVYSARMNR